MFHLTPHCEPFVETLGTDFAHHVEFNVIDVPDIETAPTERAQLPMPLRDFTYVLQDKGLAPEEDKPGIFVTFKKGLVSVSNKLRPEQAASLLLVPFPVVTSVFYVTREARYPSQRIYSVRMKFYVRSMLGFKAKDVTGDVCEVTLRRLLIIQRSAGIPDPDIKIKAQWTIHKELIHSELFGHMAIVHYQYPTENPQGFTAYNVATPLVGRVRDLWLMAHALEEEKDLAKAKEEASRKQWIFPGDIVPDETEEDDVTVADKRPASVMERGPFNSPRPDRNVRRRLMSPSPTRGPAPEPCTPGEAPRPTSPPPVLRPPRRHSPVPMSPVGSPRMLRTPEPINRLLPFLTQV